MQLTKRQLRLLMRLIVLRTLRVVTAMATRLVVITTLRVVLLRIKTQNKVNKALLMAVQTVSQIRNIRVTKTQMVTRSLNKVKALLLVVQMAVHQMVASMVTKWPVKMVATQSEQMLLV